MRSDNIKDIPTKKMTVGDGKLFPATGFTRRRRDNKQEEFDGGWSRVTTVVGLLVFF